MYLLSKSYVKAHKRRLKSGALVDVPAHYDRRVRKGVEHAPAHGHAVDHLSDDQRSRFERMHAEQHFLHHYHGHALRKQLAEKEAKIKALHDEAQAHKDAGRHVEGTRAANRALRLNAQRIRHQKDLADIEHRVNGLAEMKNKLVAGSGDIKASSDDSHKHYAEKLGQRFKPRRKVPIVRAKEDVAPKKTNRSANKFDPANHIKIAADSVEALRKQDVYRVFDEAPHEHQAWESLTDYMRENRPDLMGEVYDVRDEIGAPKNEEAERAKKKDAARQAKYWTDLEQKHDALKKHLANGGVLTHATALRVTPLSSPDHLRFAVHGVQMRSGGKWVNLTGRDVDALHRQMEARKKAGSKPAATGFKPTHELADGTPVIAGDEKNVWLDKDGNEWEEEGVEAIAKPVKPVATAKQPAKPTSAAPKNKPAQPQPKPKAQPKPQPKPKADAPIPTAPVTAAERELITQLEHMQKPEVVRLASALANTHKLTGALQSMVAMSTGKVPEAEGMATAERATAAWMAENFKMTHRRLERVADEGGVRTMVPVERPVEGIGDMDSMSVENHVYKALGIDPRVRYGDHFTDPYTDTGLVLGVMRLGQDRSYGLQGLAREAKSYIEHKGHLARARSLLASTPFVSPKTPGEKAGVMAEITRMGITSKDQFERAIKNQFHLTEPLKKETAQGAPTMGQMIDGSRSLDDLILFRMAGSLNQAKINDFSDAVRQAYVATSGISPPDSATGGSPTKFADYIDARNKALEDAGFTAEKGTSAFNRKKIRGWRAPNGAFIETGLSSMHQKGLFTLPGEPKRSSQDLGARASVIRAFLTDIGAVKAATEEDVAAAQPKEKRPAAPRKVIVFKQPKSTKTTRMPADAYYGEGTADEMRMGKKEIAGMMRQDIKRAIKDGRIPNGVKVSVRSDHNSIDLRVTGVPQGMPVHNPDHLVAVANHGNNYELRADEVVAEIGKDPRSIKRYSPAMQSVLGDLSAIHGKYNWDKSDIQSDYFHVNYYGHEGVEFGLGADEKDSIPDPKSAKLGDSITVGGNTYVLQGEPPRWHKVSSAPAVGKGAAKAETPTARRERAEKTKSRAASIVEKADHELNRDRLTNTPKRAREAGYALKEARRKRRNGETLGNIADAQINGAAGGLGRVRSVQDVELLERTLTQARHTHLQRQGHDDYERRSEMMEDSVDPAAAKHAAFPHHNPSDAQWGKERKLADRERLLRMGITSEEGLAGALGDYIGLRSGTIKADPVQEAERNLVGRKVGIDFFPTPKPLAERMATLAGVKPGMRVLEPSAGNGHLADAARAAGAEVDTIEISPDLRAVLDAKGHKVVEHDFTAFSPSEPYDAVMMNPPFSNRLDAEHVQRAYTMLKPGGRLVAITGEGVHFGSDKKAAAFRDWLDERGAEVEKLPENTFKGAQQIVQTGVNARLIVLEKPQAKETAKGEDARPSEDEYATAREYLDALQSWRARTGNANAYEQKQEDRADRYSERAEKAAKRSRSAMDRAFRETDGIPMGQPILVGHHSERGHRAAINRADRAMRTSVEEDKKAQHYRGKAASVGGLGAISTDDEDATAKLRARVEELEEAQAAMKRVNAAHKRYLKNPATLDAAKLSEQEKAVVRNYQPDYSWNPHPYASYRLKNNNANIRRLKGRLSSLESRASEETMSQSFEGGEVLYNTDENRVQILFDKKPDATVRAKLKSNGFRWSPSQGAWQRHLNGAGKYAAETALGVTLKKSFDEKRILFFSKAYIHGHYRINKKTGQRIWVNSYDDKRVTRQGKTEFAHWNHRKEHFKQHLAHGRQREALHAFHDLDHDKSHKLAAELGLHNGEKHDSKKELMQAIHGKVREAHKALKEKVGGQVKADFNKRKAEGKVGKRKSKPANPDTDTPKKNPSDKPDEKGSGKRKEKGVAAKPEAVEIPDHIKRNIDVLAYPAQRFADGLANARKTDGATNGGGRYAGEWLTGPDGRAARQAMADGEAKTQKVLGSITDPAKRKAAEDYMAQQMPSADKLTLKPAEQQWVDESAEASKKKPDNAGKTHHEYGLKYRPAGIGTVPTGHVSIGDHPSFRHGTVSYDRKLSDDEVKKFEMTPIGKVDDVVSGVVKKMGRYALQYAENKDASDDFVSDNMAHVGVWASDDKSAIQSAVWKHLQAIDKDKNPAGKVKKAAPRKLDAKPGALDPEELMLDLNGKDLGFKYRLVEADDLDPATDKADNQYRDRNRAASSEQVAAIAGNLKFRLLADAPVMDHGSPVLAEDGKTIIGGNGRTLAIRRAYDGGKASQYKADLLKRAHRFGFDVADAKGMKNPVLVRVLNDKVDIKQAAIASNEGGGARMSALEQARVDGERLGDLSDFAADDTGNIAIPANQPFIRRFLAQVPSAQRSAFMASDGRLSKEGIDRLRNAVLYRAYGDTDVLSRMIESADPGQRNVLSAMTSMAARVADVNDGIKAERYHDRAIAGDIVAAASALGKIRNDKAFSSIDDYLNQGDMFGDPLSAETKMILKYLDENLRSAKAMREYIKDYYDAVVRLGDPGQGDIFGDPVPSKSELLDNAKKRQEGATSGDLFKSRTRAGRAISGQGRSESSHQGGAAGRHEKRTKARTAPPLILFRVA